MRVVQGVQGEVHRGQFPVYQAIAVLADVFHCHESK